MGFKKGMAKGIIAQNSSNCCQAQPSPSPSQAEYHYYHCQTGPPPSGKV